VQKKIQKEVHDLFHKSAYPFKIPTDLTVGTLDTLMALSDDLNKINSQVENIAKKIERQFLDIKDTEAKLQVDNKPVDQYIKNWEWDNSRYQPKGKRLPDIVKNIQDMASRIDEDLKKSSLEFTERNMALAGLQRKRSVNFATSDLEDFLTPTEAARVDKGVENGFLFTVLVVVSKSLQKEFERTYSTIGDQIAHFGAPDRSWERVGVNDGKFGSAGERDTVKGSPVVPGSHSIVKEDGDWILYSIVILRGHYQSGDIVSEENKTSKVSLGSFQDYLEPLKIAFREKRFTIREYSYDLSRQQAGGIEGEIKRSEESIQSLKKSLCGFCSAHFGEVLIGLMHLKAIKAFVESVLRYGMPFEVCSFLIEPDSKREKQNLLALSSMIVKTNPQLIVKKSLIDEEEDEENVENLPFVCLKFAPIGV